MKYISKLFVLFLSILFIVSCQKELNFDTNGISVGSLKADSLFICLPSTINGIYSTDSTLTNENFIDVQVNIRVTGSYTIQSDTTNGYSFKGQGNVGTIGLNTIRLYGTGKPLVPGINSFIIRYDTSVCIIDVPVIGPGGNADYTFGGSGGTCTGTVLSGTYMAGTATGTGNTAELDVNILTTGNYSITTTQVNGVTFSAIGNFSNTTPPQKVLLTASGTPLAAGVFNFPVVGNGSSCAFSVTFN